MFMTIACFGSDGCTHPFVRRVLRLHPTLKPITQWIGQARWWPMHRSVHSAGRTCAQESPMAVPLYTLMTWSVPCSWPQPDRDSSALHLW